MSYSLDFNENDYEVRTLTMEGTTIRFRAFENRIYVADPVSLEYQKLNYYVPEAFYEGKTIHGFTGKTVPIFFPNASGAYASGPADRPGPNFRLWAKGKPNSLFWALAAGFAVCAPGSRGRTIQNEKGEFLGCAPAHIVDLKAAVRYLRHNKSHILGDTEHIISNGTSAGGALSALLGASGNAPEYEPYLKALGAADERDDVFAASCYTPIMNLEHADMAYEWMFRGIPNYELHIVNNVNGDLQEKWVRGEMEPAKMKGSAALIADFADYVNSLGFTDSTGAPLTLDTLGNGSFRKYVESLVCQSAQKALDLGTDLSNSAALTIQEKAVLSADLDAHAKQIGRMKKMPSFDEWDLRSPENELFGKSDEQYRHFTAYGMAHDLGGGSMAEQSLVAMMNPMTFSQKKWSGCTKNWRIRFGTLDRDTSMAISVLFALSLRNSGVQVDYSMPWGLPHAGDYDLDELFDWIRHICIS